MEPTKLKKSPEVTESLISALFGPYLRVERVSEDQRLWRYTTATVRFVWFDSGNGWGHMQEISPVVEVDRGVWAEFVCLLKDVLKYWKSQEEEYDEETDGNPWAMAYGGDARPFRCACCDSEIAPMQYEDIHYCLRHVPGVRAVITVQDNEAAHLQGWVISNCGGETPPMYEIHHIEDAPDDAPEEWECPFSSDEEAVAWVTQQALNGDALALNAISFLAQHARRGQYYYDEDNTSQEMFKKDFPAFAHLLAR